MDNIQELYKGTIRLKFVEGNHSYWVAEKKGGKWTPYRRVTGVTTFISIKDKSGPLKYWVAGLMSDFLQDVLQERDVTKYDIEEARVLHTKRLEQAATTGTKVHDWIEQYIKGNKPTMPQEPGVLAGVNGFLDWQKGNKIEILESETQLYSKKYDYPGTADAIIRIGKKKYLLDFKTSTGIYNDVLMQTAAYTEAYEEMGLGKIYGRYEVRLEKRTEEEFQKAMDKKGNVNAEYKPFEAVMLDTDQRKDFEAFIASKKLFEWNKQSDKELKALL